MIWWISESGVIIHTLFAVIYGQKRKIINNQKHNIVVQDFSSRDCVVKG